MRVLVQRVTKSSVKVDNKIVGSINKGLNVLVGFTNTDNDQTIEYMAKKVANLRIFNDENGIMNKSVIDISGQILCISQFTLYADANKGNRPSYIAAASGEVAKPLYEKFLATLNNYVKTEHGIFGAHMDVEIQNDGPITIFIEK